MNPVRLTTEQASALDQLREEGGRALNGVKQVKMLECRFYTDCLTIAARNDWDGFGCMMCSAYEELSVEQKVQDFLSLTVCNQAGENYEKFGSAGMKVGVKAGADAKVRPRKLKVV